MRRPWRRTARRRRAFRWLRAVDVFALDEVHLATTPAVVHDGENDGAACKPAKRRHAGHTTPTSGEAGPFPPGTNP